MTVYPASAKESITNSPLLRDVQLETLEMCAVMLSRNATVGYSREESKHIGIVSSLRISDRASAVKMGSNGSSTFGPRLAMWSLMDGCLTV